MSETNGTVDGLNLANLISALRREIEASQAKMRSENDSAMFVLTEVEAEVNFVIEKATSGGGGVKFYLFAAEARHEHKTQNVHKLKIKLAPAADAPIEFAEPSDRVGAE